MLKSISNLGSVLNKLEQKKINGGTKDAKDLGWCKRNYDSRTQDYYCCVHPNAGGC
ncbi:hypothetical protein [Tenacibaculum soleae]|uniref:hypothetical protein n=1 Tax=Tenacibaculum soleae TaxID=447689 RepID=UPI0023001AA0|nr:hypothetical protein [Tenacibaculum soleae]